MTLLRVLLISITFIGSVKGFPSTTRGHEKELSSEIETKETMEPIPVHTEELQTKSDAETNSEGESSIVEFVRHKDGLSVREGSPREKYRIVNLPTKNEDKNLNFLDSSKDKGLTAEPETKDDKGLTAETETKDTMEPITVHTEEPQTILDVETNSEGESTIVEFIRHEDGLRVQESSPGENYKIVNLPTKNENEKLNLTDSNKDNEIDIDGKDELHKLDITDNSSSEELLSEAQIKRDQWLYDPQEISSILGELGYDAVKPIYPFPELEETVKHINPFLELSEKAKPHQPLPELVEKSYERSDESLGGLPLFPKARILRDMEDSFYVI